MKRRGFFSRLLGLAAIPLVPVIEKEKKMDVPVPVEDLECPPGMVCINGKCAERSPYVFYTGSLAPGERKHLRDE